MIHKPQTNNFYARLLSAMQKGSTVNATKPVVPKESKPVAKLDYVGEKINIYI